MLCAAAQLRACSILETPPTAAVDKASWPQVPKWVVALTDGRDTSSRGGDFDKAVETLRVTNQLNLALITVGQEANERSVVSQLQQLVDAAKSLSANGEAGQGMRINAGNLEEIEKAFAKVAEVMVASVGVALPS